MPRGTPTDATTASLIKKLLWQGKSQERVAILAGVSQPVVSRIKAGTSFAHIPWPDGSTGAMPVRDVNAPKESGWSADAKRLLDFPERLQQSILEAVNSRRAAVGVQPIPEMAEAYQKMLDLDEEDRHEWEPSLLEDAQKAEDSRLATIMQEFDKIVAEERSALRETDTLSIISRTKDYSPRPHRAPPPLRDAPRWKWRDLIAEDPRNPLIREGVTSEDRPLQEALCIVFKAVSKGDWRSDAVKRVVYNLAERLRSQVP